jgi:hypothetical protein
LDVVPSLLSNAPVVAARTATNAVTAFSPVCEVVSATFNQPTFVLPPPVQGRVAIPPSVYLQWDSLIYLTLGKRLERDVLAPSPEVSACNIFGPPADYIALTAFAGLYFTIPANMAQAVAVVAASHGQGAFVVPLDCSSFTSTIGNVMSPSPAKKSAPTNWRTFLERHALLHISFGKYVLVYASFQQQCVRFKRFPKGRPRQYSVRRIELLDRGSPKISVLPTTITRATCTDRAETIGKDTAPTAEFPPKSADAIPDGSPTAWNQRVFKLWASKYPDFLVAELAVETVMGVLNVAFSGRTDVCVYSSNSASIVGREAELLAHFAKEVIKGWMVGPLSALPFLWMRLCRLAMVPKHKWDPLSSEFRMISDFSSGNSSSLNDTTYTPRLLSGGYCRGCHIRDALASLGRACWMAGGDVPSCFRQQLNSKDILGAMVYSVEPGIYWVDLRNPFGFRPSEWAWQTVLAVLNFRLLGLSPPGAIHLSQVDNFFRFGRTRAEAQMELTRLQNTFATVGLPLHEVQIGQTMQSLGWIWNSAALTMSITPDKLAVMRTKLAAWACASKLGGKEIESVTGLLNFLSDGCEAARPFVGCFYGLREEARRKARFDNCRIEDVFVGIKPESECAASLRTVAEIFANWNGECRIVGGFSPVAFAQAIGFTDASTLDGCGGLAYVPVPTTMAPAQEVSGFSERYPQDIKDEALVVEKDSTAFLEAYAIFRWLSLFGARFASRRILIFSDSKSALAGICRAFSKVPRLQRMIKQIRILLARHNITMRAAYVHTSRNVIADHCSHLRRTEAAASCRALLGRPLRWLESEDMPRVAA